MKYQKSWFNRNLLGFGLTSLFNDFSFEMTTALLPEFIAGLVGTHNAPAVIGIIGGLSDAASSIVKVWSGIITDRLQRYKPLLIIGYAITPICNSMIGFAKTIVQVLIYRTMAWVGRGIRGPMRDKWITEIEDPIHYGKAFGFNRALDTVGSVVGPLTAYVALQFFQISTIFWLSIIPGFVSVFCLVVLTQETERGSEIHDSVNWKEQLKRLSRDFYYFVFVMFIFGIGNFNKMLIIYRAQELLIGKSISTVYVMGWTILLYALFNSIRAMSEYGIGVLSDYINRKILLAIGGFGLFALTCILLFYTTNDSLAWIAIFIIAGVSAGTVSSLERSYAALLLTSEVRGTGFGLLHMVDGVGDLLSSVIVGYLWSNVSAEGGFAYAILLSLVAMLLLLSLPSPHSNS